MKPESFESMDKSLKERFDRLPKKAVPPAVLDGFSAAVERRILERQAAPEPAPIRRWAPAWVPALAVLVVSIIAVRLPNPGPMGAFPEMSNPASLSQEIGVLREVGVWTEEDEKLIEASDEASLEELEAVSNASSGSSQMA